MKLRSRGLGRKELVMDFRRYEIKRDGDEVLITGTITEPVTWDFSIRIDHDDIPGLIRVARSKAMVSLFFEWMRRLSTRRPKQLQEPVEISKVSRRREEALSDSGAGARSSRRGQVDSSTRRRKIEEARRQVKGRRQARAPRPVPNEKVASAVGREMSWGVSKVGAIPSGDGDMAEVANKVGERGEQNVEPVIETGGWKVRRPGAMPKVS